MGHAGAIISGSAHGAGEKIAALASAGATTVRSPAEIGLATRRVLEERA
jgi:succinyl-CoA synthetase alpha subunit